MGLSKGSELYRKMIVVLIGIVLSVSWASCDGAGEKQGATTGVAQSGSGSATGGRADSAGAGEIPARITLTKVAGGFKHPVAIAHAGDGSGRLFIAEQGGLVKILRDGKVSRTPFLDLSGQVTRDGGEQGLLGIAFPPQFASRKTFYVDYTNRVGIGNTVVAQIAVSSDPDRADPASRRELLTIAQPFANHNGGHLVFGPDNLLYIGTGDGGSAGDPHRNGQNRKALLGKLLRIDTLSGATPYAIPKDNPFGNEIWAYGLRNPWRFSFDRLTGDLYIADVGQDKVEEIDFQPAGKGSGANYGWNITEGNNCFKNPLCKKEGLTSPVAQYLHGKGDCSVTGGYLYRGRDAALQGIYFYGDFCSGRIWGLKKGGSTWNNRLVADTDYAISTFGEDEAGELYLADYQRGDLYRIGSP